MGWREIDLHRVPRSNHAVGGLSFPTRHDYVEFARANGLLHSSGSLHENEDLVLAIHHHWHTLGQQGCAFAQMVATNPPDYGWERHVQQIRSLKAPLPDTVWRDLIAAIDASRLRPEVQALSILFPDLESPALLASLIAGLCEHVGFDARYIDGPTADLKAVQLRLLLDGGVESWVVGFAPFEYLPMTRQAPIVELAFATKPKQLPLQSRRLNADLAHADLAGALGAPIPTEDVFNKVFEKTAARRLRILGGNDPFAKAKISILVPNL